MKKLLIALTALFLIGGNANAQVVSEGSVLIDGYYGFPNLYTAVFKAAYANSGTEEELTIGGIGPVGGRVEYMVADKIGLGLDIGFNNSKIHYEDNGTDVNGNIVRYDYDLRTAKFGVMATFNYHFVQNSDKVDAYVMFGAGYGNRVFEFTSTDPSYDTQSQESLIPIASRLGVGMRYFFTENIGANVALGIGQGGILNAGLSFKL